MNTMIRVAVEARMGNVLLRLGVTVAMALGLATQAQAACNARGEFCGHPAWASNAFAGPRDRVPESTLEPSRSQPSHPSRSMRIERVIKVEKAIKAEKSIKRQVAPVVRFADGSGRQFDPTTSVWFDGEAQCWAGKEAFTFKSGGWRYGQKKWAESDDGWKVASGRSPELVSCESVPSFAARASAIAARMAAQNGKAGNAGEGVTSQPAPVTSRPAKIKTAEDDTAATAQKAMAPAAPAECKKYFPSVGQMLLVPCGE